MGQLTWGDAEAQRRDQAVRTACRNAPPHIRALIDQTRQQHGMPRLWPDALKHLHLRSRAHAMQAAPMGYLVGTCTAGESVAVSCGYDRHHLPELFATHAFAHSLRAIDAGQASAWAAIGHVPDELGSTRDGSLCLWIDDHVGLCFRLRLPNTVDGRQLAAEAGSGTVGVSVGFTPRRMTTTKRRGKRYRLIQEAVISHVALCRTQVLHPAFRHNRVLHTFASTADGLMAVGKRAALSAWLLHKQSTQR